MKFARLPIQILLFFVSIWVTQTWAAADITHFRAAADADKTRLVFEITEKPDYLLLNLSDPDRLVLDIKNVAAVANLAQHFLKGTPVKAIRSHIDNKNLRMVLDLNHPVTTKSFVLPPSEHYRYRLVIDLTRAATVAKATPIVPVKPSLAVLPMPERKITIAPVVKKVIAKVAPLKPTTVTTPPPVATPVAHPTPVVTAPPRAPGRDIIVVIDPGHGGKDPGTTGATGTHEKDVVLAISKALQRELNNEPGFKAVLTRNDDTFVPLRGRLDIARKDKADIFIAIHADAFPTPGAMGASVFALSERGATSEAARWLAEKENKSELLGGASLPDNDNVLRSVLIDLSQTNTISESLQIGSAVLRQLGNVTTLHHARVEQAAFVVLKSPDIPSLLVETGFLSTPAQEKQLRNPQYQNALANAIMQGVKSYFVRNPPQGTVFASG